jgi:tetratricopeptide (TPR) repeat protein
MDTKPQNPSSIKSIFVCLIYFLFVFTVVPVHAIQDAKKDAAQDKTITDQAEYDVYIKALNETNAAAKGAAMMAFVEKYPKSVVLNDALTNALGAFQQAGDESNMAIVSKRILEIDPNNIRALALLTFMARQKASVNNDVKLAAEAAGYADRGLKAIPDFKKPDGMSDADFSAMGRSLSDIFYGAIGFNSFVGKKYSEAKSPYQKALAVDPNNILDNYQLGISLLMLPVKDTTGVWYVAKAASLSKDSPAMHKVIEDFGKSALKNIYKTDAGWDALVAKTAKEDAPPAATPAKAIPAKKTVKK